MPRAAGDILNAAQRDAVEAAVRAAEAGTAGEIVVVIARQAGLYRTVPLAYALVSGLAAPWALFFLTDLSTPRILALQVAIALCVLVLVSWCRLRIAPPSLKRAQARSAAAREFVARGMADTRGRTGVLLYVALAERYAEVIGDVAIRDRVAESDWREVIEGLVSTIETRPTEALTIAVERIGRILAEHVPPGADDRDELPNRVVLL